MNETNHLDGASNKPGSAADDRYLVPNTSMLPGTEKARSAGAGVLKNAVQGAHTTIDRLADGAAPVIQKLEEGFSSSQEALQAKTEQLRGVRDAWTEGVRNTVRNNPLASVATAVALGLVIARINRWRHPQG